MTRKYTSSDQVKFLGEWFNTWLDYQKEEFLPVLVQALKPSDNVNGIVNDISDIKISGRRPSLFDCQVKLFHDWFHMFTSEEKSKFLENVKDMDVEFTEKLNKMLLENDQGDETAVPITNGLMSITKEDDSLPGSSSSSTLSSISQLQSPQISVPDDDSNTVTYTDKKVVINSLITASPFHEEVDSASPKTMESVTTKKVEFVTSETIDCTPEIIEVSHINSVHEPIIVETPDTFESTINDKIESQTLQIIESVILDTSEPATPETIKGKIDTATPETFESVIKDTILFENLETVESIIKDTTEPETSNL